MNPAADPLAMLAPSSPGQASMTPPRDLRDPVLYINRELSQLEFNFRVLAQAQDPTVPLLERLRFLCISSSNIDEFFEIRVAALKLGGATVGPDGLSLLETLHRVRSRAIELLDEQYRLWNKTLRPALAAQGINVLMRDEWNAKQRRWLS